MSRSPTIVLALGAAGALWLVALAGRSAPPESAVRATFRTVAVAAPARPFAPSLQGTRLDGGVHVAPDDSVVADARLIELFDYYLSTVGEKSPEAVRAEIERGWVGTPCPRGDTRPWICRVRAGGRRTRGWQAGCAPRSTLRRRSYMRWRA